MAKLCTSGCGWGVQVALGGRCVRGADWGYITRNVGVEYLRKYNYTLSIKSSMLWRIAKKASTLQKRRKKKVFHLLCFLL